MYRGGFAVFAVAVAVLIAAAVAPGNSLLRRVLSVRPLRLLGGISYGLYLWHWPVQVALDPTHTGLDGLTLDGVRIAATFALATLSFYVVERPIRRGLLGRRAFVVTPLAVASVVSGVVLVAAAAVPPPSYLRNNGDTSIRTALRSLPAAAVDESARRVCDDPLHSRHADHAAAPATADTGGVPGDEPGQPAGPVRAETPPPRRRLRTGEPPTWSRLGRICRRCSARIGRSPRLRHDRPANRSDPATPATHGRRDADATSPTCSRQPCGADRPDVVAWLSGWESADRILGDQTVRIETPRRVPDRLRPRRPGRAAPHLDRSTRRVPHHAGTSSVRRRGRTIQRHPDAATG